MCSSDLKTKKLTQTSTATILELPLIASPNWSNVRSVLSPPPPPPPRFFPREIDPHRGRGIKCESRCMIIDPIMMTSNIRTPSGEMSNEAGEGLRRMPSPSSVVRAVEYDQMRRTPFERTRRAFRHLATIVPDVFDSLSNKTEVSF